MVDRKLSREMKDVEMTLKQCLSMNRSTDAKVHRSAAIASFSHVPGDRYVYPPKRGH